MNSNVSHPGYLYQISRNGEGDIQSLLKQASDIKEKEQMLYVYLTPLAASSSVNPFNNCRLKTIMNEVEVVVFDTPPEKEKTDPIDQVCKLLQENYSKETLLRINDSLTQSLKSIEVNLTKVDEKVGDNPEKLAAAVALKVLILIAKNLGGKQTDVDSTDSVDNHVTPTVELEPKQRIHKTAQELGKTIEYIDERDFIGKNKELLFDKGFLELMLCSFITDQGLVQALMKNSESEEKAWNTCTVQNSDESELPRLAEKNPTLIELGEKWKKSDGDITEMFTLGERINTYLSSKKKTLLVLEMTPKEIKKLKPFISINSGDYAEMTVKGPIKEPTGCFWKIKKNDVTVGYLLGSIHATPNYLLDLNSRIRKCFERSSRLAVEIDLAKEVKSKSFESNSFWSEKYRTLSGEQISRLCKILKKLFPEEAAKVNFAQAEKESAFISRGITKLKFRIWKELEISSGIDLQLLDQARKLNKPVESLETQEQYAQQKTTQNMLAVDPLRDLFLKFLSSEELQELEETDEVMKILIEQISIYQKEALQPMFDAWEEGNLEEFDASKTDSTDQKMDMTRRNMNMAIKIVNLVNEQEKLFCCVGAAHTVGEMNVQAFLKNFGFSTERVFV